MVPGHHSRQHCRLFALVGVDEFVGPDRHGLRSFGVIAQGQAGPVQQLESFEPAGGSITSDGRLTAPQPVR